VQAGLKAGAHPADETAMSVSPLAGAKDAILELARAIDAADPATSHHSERVGELAGDLAAELDWSPTLIAALDEAGRLHDVGKICIPEAILTKPGRLTPEEFEHVKAHTVFGAQLVANVLMPAQTAWIRGHHERWNGRGYPDGLAGEQIPQGALILSIVDAWDTMTSASSYAPVRSAGEAIVEMRAGSGTQFWPEGIAALERVLEARATGRGPRPVAGTGDTVGGIQRHIDDLAETELLIGARRIVARERAAAAETAER
jgi:HD-GYP domain-containing protein (c-di-GMP phosphodiesterase class II)